MCLILVHVGVIYSYSCVYEYFHSVFCSCHYLITSGSFSGYIFLKPFNHRCLRVVRCLIAVECLRNTIKINIKYRISQFEIFQH